MPIAIIADTHDNLPSSARAALIEAEEIWHLGDVSRGELLREIQGLGPPVQAIQGNCDPRGLAPETLTLQRGSHLFYLVHEPPTEAPLGVTFVLHGHTHVPRDETIRGVRYLNPGTVGKPNHGAPPSLAWLTIKEGQAPIWEIVRLS